MGTNYNCLWCMALCLVVACSPGPFSKKSIKQQAPDVFMVRFTTSKGAFDVRVQRQWSPLAADRFYWLVHHRYYHRGVFYRVVPGFVAQFGNSDTTIRNQWNAYTVPDEPVTQQNLKGRIAFARSGPQSRGTELFINLQDNVRLDTITVAGVKGYPPFGEVVAGMDVVLKLHAGYADTPRQQLSLLYRGRAAFFGLYPLLDTIQQATIIKRR